MLKGTEGLLVEKENDKRVYMITEEASEEYLRTTKYNRMPSGEKKNYIKQMDKNKEEK